VTDADVPIGVDDLLPREDSVGDDEILDQGVQITHVFNLLYNLTTGLARDPPPVAMGWESNLILHGDRKPKSGLPLDVVNSLASISKVSHCSSAAASSSRATASACDVIRNRPGSRAYRSGCQGKLLGDQSQKRYPEPRPA
jgi:hypothetical protein